MISCKNDFSKMFRFCLKIMVKKSKFKMILWIILNIITSLTPSLLIILNRNIINYIKEKESYEMIILLLLLVGFLQIIIALLSLYTNYIYEIIKKDIDYYIYRRLYEKLTITPLERFEDNEYFNTVTMAQRAVQMNGVYNIKYIIDIFKAFITMLSVVMVLLIIHWSLPIALIISMVPGFVGTIIAKSIDYKNNVDLLPSERMQSYISSLFFNKNFLKEAKIFKLRDYLLTKWSEIFKNIKNAKIKILAKESKITFIGNNVIQISTVIVNIYLVYNIFSSKITLGDYVALTEAIVVLQSELGNIAMNVGELFEIGLYNKSLMTIINEDSVATFNNEDMLEKIQTLELKNISFKYPNNKKTVLNNISLKINKGEKIAIVGYNGSGKSTLINIILGIYTNIEGDYELNGIKVDKSTINKYQSRMTMIFQDFIRYKLSIRENVAFGNIQNISNDELIKDSLREVGLEENIEKLPCSINTILSKEFTNGTELSGGEWQKLAMARSLIKDSDVVIFDEPTSALDPIAELEVSDLLNNTCKDKTTIMISHRLGITKFADRIIVMKEGKIIERGSHKELIKKNGEYKKLYESQAEFYR
ncbi:MAG: ABC transporter ATP-binding protein [Clostridium butyricum]|nr:ABC transporter ATP-binding protein [Clostridium butyricum]MDU5821659.1 ABC transporter ATP-binding protein [Clostridium butyricum]